MRLIFLLMLLTACITSKQRAKICAECPVRDSVISVVEYVHKDSIIQLPADSSWLRLYLDCDSLGRLQVRDSAGQQPRIQIQTVIRDKYIQVQAKTDTTALYVRWKEQHKRETVIRERVVKVPAELTQFQQFRLTYFWYLAFVLLLLVIFAIIRSIR